MATGTFYPLVSGDDTQQLYLYNPATPTIIIGQSGGGLHDGWWRFPNVSIPSGATIVSAYITFIAAFNNSDYVPSRIYGHAADDSETPNNVEYTTVDFTTEYKSWSIPEIFSDTPCQSPEIIAIIQEIVDRPGWVVYNALSIAVKDNGALMNKIKSFHSIDYDGGAQKAELHVEWIAPAAVDETASWNYQDAGSNITLSTDFLTATHA